nr:acetyl-CoA carboxylase biotin carboxyl carrier protein [Dehalococcoidia bacterium]
MIDPDLIEHLIKVLDDSDIDSLEIERGGTRIRLGKTPIHPVTVGLPPSQDEQAVSSDPLVQDSPTSFDAKSGSLVEVTSPMVGTFYSAPTPDAPPYIEI